MDSTKRPADGTAERAPRRLNGMAVMVGDIILMLASAFGLTAGLISIIRSGANAPTIGLMVAAGLWLFLIGPVVFVGLKIVRPNEAMVLTLFGRYYGCLREAGFWFVNPFSQPMLPASADAQKAAAAAAAESQESPSRASSGSLGPKAYGKTISLKAQTLSNDKQKVNDALGNPVIIGVAVVWKVVDPTKAVLDVDDYPEYLSIQCDSALRNIVRLYPYDSSDEEQEKSLRGSSQEVAGRLKDEIQAKVNVAGIEILEARITHLSYAPEIAAAMLQRQQASAIIAAKQKIVEGAVGMVEMALEKLNATKIVHLDEERTAAMVSNLLVVLCANKDTQPIVNSGSIY